MRHVHSKAMPGQGSDQPLPPRRRSGKATERTPAVSMPGLPVQACWNEKAELSWNYSQRIDHGIS